MRLTLEEVEHIAELARLELTQEEKERFRRQLSSILEHVARLGELDTAGISPTASVLPDQNTLREDIPRLGLSQEEVLANAPDTHLDQFRVPPVLDPPERP